MLISLKVPGFPEIFEAENVDFSIDFMTLESEFVAKNVSKTWWTVFVL